MKISILCPTRARPDNMQRLCASVWSTAKNPKDVEVIFYIDEDDEASIKELSSLKLNYGQFVNGLIGGRVVLSEMWNLCCKISNGEILMHCGDDIIFRTLSWDTAVLNAFNLYDDKLVFVHGSDGFNAESFGTHGFLHRNWVDIVGYFVPPYFSSDYNDTWLNDVANLINRRIFINIYTEHMHPLFGKAELDLTHQERLERHKLDGVDQLYLDKQVEREMDANKLLVRIKEAELKSTKS